MGAKFKIALAAILLVVPVLGLPQDGIETGISRTGPRAIRLAVPEFRTMTPGGQTAILTQIFNETLWSDLDFSGNIELASRSFYPAGNFVVPGDIKVPDWTAPGISAQYVAYGSALVNGTTFLATGRLRDLGVPQDSFGIIFRSSADEAGARIAAHNLADKIMETLGLGRGVARTSIAFVSDRSGSKEIFQMDYDGRNQQQLTAVGFIAIAPNWSPRDDRIAYTAWRAGGQAQIEILSTSGERHTFQQPRNVTNGTPSWSPDGESIVFQSRRDGDSEIYFSDADGRNARRLTTSPGIDTSPVFNPATGKQIAFVSNRTGLPQIYLMNSDGTNVLRIADEGGDMENPAWSPDGKMIAFAWQKARVGVFDIYLYEITTGRFTQLTNNEGSNERPSWAPDIKHIAFHSNRTGTNQIYSMTLDGKKVQQLTTRGMNEGPTWSGYAAP